MSLYELALLGAPTPAQVQELESTLRALTAPFALTFGNEIAWTVSPASFKPSQRRASAAIFMGAEGIADSALNALLRDGVPIIPVVSNKKRFHAELPEVLRRFNGLSYADDGAPRIASALLECANLLPRQRRVFLSYRREESRAAALQLFDALSARLFDVFLDTHGIPPAEDFQAQLWHRLCDSDVLIMLDTPGYFESRWTRLEFGRALAKNIAVLRIGWPGTPCSPRARTVEGASVDLMPDDFDASSRFSDAALERICIELEALRSMGVALRQRSLVNQLQIGIEKLGGAVEGVGLHRAIHIRLPGGSPLTAYPSIWNPTSHTLHEALTMNPDHRSAVVYDHVGLHSTHLGHLDWLSELVPGVRLVKACEVAWQLADMDAK